jgi:5-methylcytosine-specific restriction protein A
MNLEKQFEEELLNNYTKAGKELGYWAHYFYRSLKNNGGLETAKRMLGKKLINPSYQKGFQTLLDAGRLDLSVESLVLEQRFRKLFTTQELAEAKQRLNAIPEYAKRKIIIPQDNYPDDLADDQEFIEGAKKSIIVNAYERNPQARKACLKVRGYNCSVCNLNFEKVYGSIGKQFIHVHHKIPRAAHRSTYVLKPKKDLVPVCPNCHAMLHTSNPPLGIEELKERLAN